MISGRTNTGLDALFSRQPPTPWQRFLSSPTKFLATHLYQYHQRHPIPTPSTPDPIHLVCISDTHNKHPHVPPGDVLIHAGDLTNGGTLPELQSALDWLSSLPHRHKVVISGNHDALLADPHAAQSLSWRGVEYLQDSWTILGFPSGRSIAVYGSPWTPRHGSFEFQYPRHVAREQWSGKIPEDTDVLVTHGPPFGHLDCGGMAGCMGLLEEIWRVRPRVHVFGHVHAGRGVEVLGWDEVQRAYEQVLGGGGGFRGLVGMVVGLVRGVLGWGGGRRGGTVLVNAAVVGGLRDERLRDGVVVDV